MRILAGLLSCSLSATTLLSAGAFAQTVSFPGRTSEAKSPDGRYSVKNADDEHKNPAHNLTFWERKSGTERDFYVYSRSVDVIWSPGSNVFVVNDHGGSNFSRPVLFVVPPSGSNVDLWKRLIEYLTVRRRVRSALENHHVYFTGQRWLNDHELLCKLTGYGEEDPKGFTNYYVYDLLKGFRETH